MRDSTTVAVEPTADQEGLCIRRKRRGKGFQYLDEMGNTITDSEEVTRIRQLVIPPMWTMVRICKCPKGHIQATGRDAKGRKQYIYHSAWERKRQEEKFARLAEFGSQLNKLRKKAQRDLRQAGWPKAKVLALMVEILDETGIRIGNRCYSKSNQSYGLSTLRRKHVRVDGADFVLSFKGKSHQQRTVTIEDQELITYIKQVAELPGHELFRFRDQKGRRRIIDSGDVNHYIAAGMGGPFTSKDFRTWVGSRLAIEYWPEAHRQTQLNPRKKLDATLVRMVADQLGNTPSVCRTYYVHPEILKRIENKEMPDNPHKDSKGHAGLSASEKLLMALIAPN